MQERHVDLRIQKTREAINNTFKKMVCEMDATKITVKELTERARIHRKTFYLHYTSIEALFEDMLLEHRTSILQNRSSPLTHGNGGGKPRLLHVLVRAG
jgi:AcrR family transcriptional regulator